MRVPLTAARVAEARNELRQLEKQYAEEGEPMEPRQLRLELATLTANVDALSDVVRKLQLAVYKINRQAAEECGVPDEIPF